MIRNLKNFFKYFQIPQLLSNAKLSTIYPCSCKMSASNTENLIKNSTDSHVLHDTITTVSPNEQIVCIFL